MFLLIGPAFFHVSSCQRYVEKQTSGDAVSPAEEASKACSSGESIAAQCVVSFYSGNGSKYISEQQHMICPVSETITILADEPQGSFIWELSGDSFQILKGTVESGSVPKAGINRAMAKIILTSLLAGGGFTLESEGLRLDPAKIDGQWYQPIEFRLGPPSSWAWLRLFQNMDSMKIDMVKLEDAEQKILLIARSYNYRWIDEIGKSLPTKINVFSTDNKGFPLQQLLQIDYQQIGVY
jgi:hypothetical protein